MSAFIESGHLTRWKSSEMKGGFRPQAAVEGINEAHC
jgi:hypothetical protein